MFQLKRLNAATRDRIATVKRQVRTLKNQRRKIPSNVYFDQEDELSRILVKVLAPPSEDELECWCNMHMDALECRTYDL